MRFLILGAGALGGYYGGMLLRGGAEVAFLVRPGRAAQLARHGLLVEAPGGGFAGPVKTVAAGAVDEPYDVVLLACKAYDLPSALDAVSPALGPQSAVLPILNGVNHIEILVARFGRGRVLGGIGLINAELATDGTIVFRLAAEDHIVFGELDGARSARCLAMHGAFAAGGVASRISDQILAEMWGKLALYAPIATIATLTRARAGEIAAAPGGAAFVEAAIAEIANVVDAEGFTPPSTSAAFVRKVYAQRGSDYRPSILMDLEAGRPTEGEHTLGDLVRRAERTGVAAPLLRAALCSLEIAEARRVGAAARPD